MDLDIFWYRCCLAWKWTLLLGDIWGSCPCITHSFYSPVIFHILPHSNILTVFTPFRTANVTCDLQHCRPELMKCSSGLVMMAVLSRVCGVRRTNSWFDCLTTCQQLVCHQNNVCVWVSVKEWKMRQMAPVTMWMEYFWLTTHILPLAWG